MQAKEILRRASITLQDSGFVRWPVPELLIYLNDAMQAIALHKPNAVTDTIELSLQEGTLQRLEGNHISLIRMSRNLTSVDEDEGGRKGGTAITAVSRTTLDSIMAGWQDATVLPFSATVEHVIQDMADPRSFYVVPGNDGTGIVEAVVSILPTEIAEPTNPLSVDSYTAELTLPDVLRGALVDYVMYRAYSKDAADPNNASRAQAHYQMFANAIGLKVQTEQVMTTNSTGDDTRNRG
jgi:hypothetical protein